MSVAVGYQREQAVAYAKRWALGRNPRYADFEQMGGDCTNFVSQCLFAGGGVMNFTPVFGWYYRSLSDRAPAWTGVEFLYRFLTTNKGPGPYAEKVTREEIEPGDIIQLGDGSRFYHSPIAVLHENGEIYIAAHSYDVYMRPLESYAYMDIRFLHILGFRN